MAEQLTQLPQHDRPPAGAALFAGPPFELPEDPFLPEDEAARLRRFGRLLDESKSLIRQLREIPGPQELLDVVQDLEGIDNAMRAKIGRPANR